MSTQNLTPELSVADYITRFKGDTNLTHQWITGGPQDYVIIPETGESYPTLAKIIYDNQLALASSLRMTEVLLQLSNLQTIISQEIQVRTQQNSQEIVDRNTADNDIKNQLNVMRTSVGLDVNGSYVAPLGTNYLDNTSTVAGALLAIDAAIKGARDTAAADSAGKVDKSGSSMTGNLVMQSGTHITITDYPQKDTDAVNKSFVEARLNGLSWKQNVQLATTDPLDLAIIAAPVIDEELVADGDRVLVKNQLSTVENGIYVFKEGVGFSRAVDADESTELHGATLLVVSGALQKNTSWTCPLDANAVVGGDPIYFFQHNGATSVIPGVGLTKVGNQLDVSLGAGIAQLPSNDVGIDLTATGGLFLTEDGISESTGTNAQLAIKLEGATLTTSAAGLKVADGGISAVHLDEGIVGNGLTGAAGMPLAVNPGVGILIVDDKVTLDQSVVDTKIADEVTRAEGVEQDLQTQINDLKTQAGDGASALKTQINDNRVTFESVGAQLTYTIVHNFNTKFYLVQLMVQGADGVYRNDLVSIEEDAIDPTNKLNITLTEARKIKGVVLNMAAIA